MKNVVEFPSGRVSRAAPGLSIVSMVALAVIGCLVLSAAREREARAKERGEEDTMAQAARDAGAPNKKAQIKREGKKVWIEGVPTLSWGKSGDTTYAGAMAAALSVTEKPYSYADIMGFSGLAFRVRWWWRKAEFPGWCPSTPVGEFPEELAATANGTGWKLRVIDEMADEKAPHMERYKADIVASIDAGKPVPAYPGGLNVGVIFGYEDGGKTFLIRDYFKGDEVLRQPAEKIGPMLIILQERGEALSRRGALIQAMRIAVTNWSRAVVRGEKGGYYYGDEAMARWIEDLAGHDKWDEEQRKGLFFANWWNYEALADARKSAAEFLGARTDVLSGPAADAVKRAAETYAKEAKLLGPVCDKRGVFFGPWSGKKQEDWTAAVRQREQAVLAEARKLEASAVAEMAKALAAERARTAP